MGEWVAVAGVERRAVVLQRAFLGKNDGGEELSSEAQRRALHTKPRSPLLHHIPCHGTACITTFHICSLGAIPQPARLKSICAV